MGGSEGLGRAKSKKSKIVFSWLSEQSQQDLRQLVQAGPPAYPSAQKHRELPAILGGNAQRVLSDSPTVRP